MASRQNDIIYIECSCDVIVIDEDIEDLMTMMMKTRQAMCKGRTVQHAAQTVQRTSQQVQRTAQTVQ